MRPTRELARQIREIAQERGVGISTMMNRMVEEWMQRSSEQDRYDKVLAFRRQSIVEDRNPDI